LADEHQIGSDVWSVTSYTQLRRDAQDCERWNRFHPLDTPRKPYVAEMLEGVEGPCVAASDYVRALAEQIDPWVPGGLYALGTDGMGRSESRAALRRHFEVDAETIVVAALYQLSKRGQCDPKTVAAAIQKLGINPDKPNPLFA
jgi:pyruvate dehydrogenase E1 component